MFDKLAYDELSEADRLLTAMRVPHHLHRGGFLVEGPSGMWLSPRAIIAAYSPAE
jgi:hypothetical protein